MKHSRIITAALAALILAGGGCLGGGGGQGAQLQPVTLEYWRIEDDPSTMEPIIEAYKRLHPNVTINYRLMRTEDYERTLLEALAENRGPDLFSIPNTWMRGWREKILPMPTETTIPTPTVDAQKRVVVVNKKTPTMNLLQLRDTFVEAAAKDVVMFEVPTDPTKRPEERIFGLPFSVDTLSLFYNKELFRRANIENPPVSWRDVQEQAARLTILDEDGRTIKQSGAAIGTSRNVAYAADLVASIMMQNGAQMADESGWPMFDRYTEGTRDKAYPPGVEALIFYQGFSTQGAQNYSWNGTMPNSLDAFITGRTAMFFGYPRDLFRIRDRAPSLDFAVAPIPQITPSRPANLAHFPIEVVSRKTKFPNEAWDFLLFATAAEQAEQFLAVSKRPTSLRALITPQLQDPDAAPFVGQVLTARTWYRGFNWSAVEQAFITMIETRPTTQRPEYLPIVAEAVNVVQSTMRAPR